MSRSLALLLACLLPAAASAVPAPPFPIHLRNAGGSTVAARMLGDEHLSWFEDLDGYAIAFDSATGSWRFAQLSSDGRLSPTVYRVGTVDPRALNLVPHLAPTDAVKQKALSKRPRSLRHPRALGGPSGTIHNLVLLVRFPDQTAHFQPADFDPVFNGATGSVHEFYSKISYGKVDLVSTITDWITLPRTSDYYTYNAERPYGHPEQMIRDAIATLDSQGFDFSPFDADHDGVIDAVDVIHTGGGYEYTGDPNLIHSHYVDMRQMGANFTTASGLNIVAYHTEPEFGPNMTSITQIGVICHETGHFFGLPDLYDYNYKSGGLGLWSLMSAGAWAGPGNNGTRPTHPDAWSASVLGFVTPVAVNQDSVGQRLSPVELSGEVVRIDAGMPAGQYFLLENRQLDCYDNYLPGQGLLIFHVDENVADEDNPSHYLVDLEQADGRRDLNKSEQEWGDNSDPFPLPGNKAFTPSSAPNSQSYGRAGSKIWVNNIARQGSDITFDVAIRDPLPNGTVCTEAGLCQSGFCVDGVCCDKACGGGICDACAKALGATADGTCTPLNGTACDDSNPCTTDDVCNAGLCRGTTKSCAARPCQSNGYCDPRRGGECVYLNNANGSSCDDGDVCTKDKSCQDGACVGTPAIQCDADECQAPVCDPSSGACSTTPVEDGTPCSRGGVCQSGECKGQKCGCSSAGAATAPAGFALLALLAIRRRARRS